MGSIPEPWFKKPATLASHKTWHDTGIIRKMKKFKRRALLIGSYGRGDDKYFVNGILSDLRAVEGFLQGRYGGSFEQAEMFRVLRPDKTKMNEAISWIKDADYAFVYFSGHGFSYEGKACINLKDDYDIFLHPLATLAKRQITITDTCRNEMSSFLGESFETGDPLSGIERNGNANDRAIFNHLMMQQPFGRVIIQGTGYNTSAYSTMYGGNFTNAFLENVRNFSVNGWAFRYKTNALLDHCRITMQMNGSMQVPQMKFTSSVKKSGLLFAVQPDNYLRARRQRVG